MSDLIGQWAARFKGEVQVTKWHYVESVIADRLVTHCGRQLHNEIRTGRVATDEYPAPTMKCERCAK